MFEFAPKQTLVTLASQTPIENSLPIRVWGILFQVASATGTSEVVSIQSADGTVTYLKIPIVVTGQHGDRLKITTPFIADKGLRFVADSGDNVGIDITVYHSQAGS